MGQKVSPIAVRLGITEDSASNWYASKKDFAKYLSQDFALRQYFKDEYKQAMISKVLIERLAKSARVTINSARPATLIGRGGADADKLRKIASRILGVDAHIKVNEVRKPELDAKLVAETVAGQLEKRIMFRRAMKRAVTSAKKMGAKGIKVSISGRLGGAEIARTEWYLEGRVPLHTFRANIDYALAEAHTTYGVIGVKVWIFKGEKIREKGGARKMSERVED